MTDLDDLEACQSLDPSGMGDRIRELPAQLRLAWEQASAFALPQEYRACDKVVVVGMGGSAIGGDLVRALVVDESTVPITVHRDYGIPAFVDERTLAVASSYSGGTEETLNAFAAALDRGAKGVAITTGGRLGLLAQAQGLPLFVIPYAAAPRAALAWSLVPLLAIVQHLGFVGDQSVAVAEAADIMEALMSHLDATVPVAQNRAKALAQRLQGRLPIIYGGGFLGPVARRWKTQLNENAKASAFFEIFPELNHNTTVGYEFPSQVLNNSLVLLLDGPDLHPRIRLRYEITADFLSQAGIAHETLTAPDEGRLPQMMSLLLLGDWVSYYLALLHGRDPMPVAIIDELKWRLGHA